MSKRKKIEKKKEKKKKTILKIWFLGDKVRNSLLSKKKSCDNDVRVIGWNAEMKIAFGWYRADYRFELRCPEL